MSIFVILVRRLYRQHYFTQKKAIQKFESLSLDQ